MNKIKFIPVLLLFAANATYALGAACIQTKPLRGDTCNNLVVHFDFSGCGAEAMPDRDVRSRCVNQKAVSFIKTNDSLYIATYGAPVTENGAWRKLSVRREERKAKGTVENAPTNPNVGTAVVVPSPVLSEPAGMNVTVKKATAADAIADKEVLPQNEGHGSAANIVATTEYQHKGEVPPPAPTVAPIGAAVPAPPPPTGQPPTAAEPAHLAQPEPVKSESLVKEEKHHHNPFEGIELEGYLDFYYAYDTNTPTNVNGPSTTSNTMNTTPAGNILYHAYDNYHDSPSLNMAELTVKKEVEGAGARVDLGFGNQATLLSPNDPATQNILQAYAHFDINPELRLRVGKMYGPFGVEGHYSYEDINYSRSLLFTNGMPVWSDGVALDWSIIPKELTASLYVMSALQGNYSVGATKADGFRLEYKNSDLRIRYNYEIGATNSARLDIMRQIHEVNLKWKPCDHMEVQADALMGYQNMALANGGDASWYAAWVALAAHHGKYMIGPRLEYYADPQGYTLDGQYGAKTGALLSQNLISATLTNAYEIAAGTRAVLELRDDVSDQSAFPNNTGSMQTSQAVITLALTYEF